MYVFDFRDDKNKVLFRCQLACVQCTATKVDGGNCTRKSCIGIPLCYMHLLREKKLRIKQSTIPGAGKGLFAMDKHAGANEIIFRIGDKIVVYNGEVVTHAELNRRYGDRFTAPYAVSEGRAVVDAACTRGVGSIANYATGGKRNNAQFSYNRRTKLFTLVATKNIRNGAEIFVTYGRAYRLHDRASHTTRSRPATFQVGL